jgi:hypothetical protein
LWPFCFSDAGAKRELDINRANEHRAGILSYQSICLLDVADMSQNGLSIGIEKRAVTNDDPKEP